jgi:hydrogenase nickel incorporation protein HypA/HybF
MHELAVCQALLDQVTDVARAHGAAGVQRIAVQVGPLSGVLPELLAQAFSVARAGTAASGAVLEIEEVPLRVRCERCGAETAAAVNRLLCGACGDYHTRVVSGDELLLARVELVTRKETLHV